MGLINKARTSSRTAEKRVPNLLGGGDDNASIFDTDIVVRAAATLIGRVSRTSSTLRGRTSSLAPVFGIGEVSSDLWFERTEFGNWIVTLGADTTVGTTIDWQVVFGAVHQGGVPTLSVTTVSALTRDGALVQADAHDGVRKMVAEAISGGELPDRQGPTDVSEAAFITPMFGLRETAPASFSDRFLVTTPLSLDDVAVRLDLVQGRRVKTTQDNWTYRLGLESSAEALGSARVEDAGDRRLVHCAMDFTATGRLVADAVAHRKATGFANAVLSTVRLWDGEAEISRPEGA